MWAEYVDKFNFNGRVFPRLAAVAERLWGPPGPEQAEVLVGEQGERDGAFRGVT